MTADRQGVARPDLAAARLYTAVVSDILDGLGHRDHTLNPAIRLLGGAAGAADVVVAGWANPFLVAEAGAGLVAFLIGGVEPQTAADPEAEQGVIHHLWVEPDYRHEGLGRQLTMLALEMFANLGVRQVRLTTATANEAARGMFASCGFRPSAVEMSIEIKPTKGQSPGENIITLGDPTWPTIS